MCGIFSDSPNPRPRRSSLITRNITIDGRRTSIRLEPAMWLALEDIARRESCHINDICSVVHLRKPPRTTLTAGIRVFLMLYYKAATTPEGHEKAGHGNFLSMLKRGAISLETYPATIPRRTTADIMKTTSPP